MIARSTPFHRVPHAFAGQTLPRTRPFLRKVRA